MHEEVRRGGDGMHREVSKAFEGEEAHRKRKGGAGGDDSGKKSKHQQNDKKRFTQASHCCS